MKKRRLSYILLVAAIVATCAFMLSVAACNRNPSKIDTPSLNYSPYEVTWERCDCADKYAVYVEDISGELQSYSGYVYAPRLDLEYYKGKRVRIRVRAISGDRKRVDSDEAEAVYNVNAISAKAEAEEEKAIVSYTAYSELSGRYFYNLKRVDGSDNLDDFKLRSGSGALRASGVYAVGFKCAYDSASGESIISSEYLRGFSAGAVIPLTSSDSSVFEVEIVDSPVARVINGEIGSANVYYKSLQSHMYLLFDADTYVRKIYADGEISLDFTQGEDRRGVKVSYASMAALSQGIHTLTLYTDRGDIRARVIVIDDYSFRLDNLRVDIDGYPNIALNWDAGLAPDYYTVVIGGRQYRSDSAEHSDMFNPGGMNISDIAREGDRIKVTAYSGDATLSAETTVPYYSRYITYLLSDFEYIGESYNLYVDSESEWIAAVGHTVLHYDSLPSGIVYDKSITLALAVEGYASSDLTVKFQEAVKAFRELVSYNCEIRPYADDAGARHNDIFVIDITVNTCVTPERNYTSLDETYRDLIVPVYKGEVSAYLHYGDGSRGDSYDDFAIESISRGAVAHGSDELYFIIESGFRPIIEDVSSPAGRMYNKAKDVLRRIIDDSMSDYDKVHAITDYLNGEVTYDYAVAKYESELLGSAAYSSVYPFNSFFLEGVFDDGVAVCNGLAKAFVVLCGIEGIRSVKIQGYTSPLSKSGRHAWNKASVGGEWYGIDTTWDNVQAEIDGVKTRLASHTYAFLTSERLERTGHYQDSGVKGSEYYCGDSAYNLYANMVFNDGGKLYDHIVKDKSELETLLRYYTTTYGGDRIVVYAYCDSRLIAGAIAVTSDGYKVNLKGREGECIYILDKVNG